MAPRAANITSIEAVRGLKVALQQFAADAHDAFVMLELEGRRPVEWIEHDRTRYWPEQQRKASDEMSEARGALQRCRLTTVAGNPRSCYEEQQALEAAKRRVRLTAEKVEKVRSWRVTIRREVDEFQVHLAKLQRFLDGDLLRAIAVLDKMAVALDKYVESHGPQEDDGIARMWAAARLIMSTNSTSTSSAETKTDDASAASPADEEVPTPEPKS